MKAPAIGVTVDVPTLHPESDKGWAGVGSYLNVVRMEEPHTGPAGNSTDFPISSDLDDEQILVAFVTVVTSIIGGGLEFC